MIETAVKSNFFIFEYMHINDRWYSADHMTKLNSVKNFGDMLSVWLRGVFAFFDLRRYI